MANLKSSIKDIKKSRARAARNTVRLAELKRLTKKLAAAAARGEAEEVKGLFKTVQSKIARAAGKGVIKKNSAARTTARLAKRVGVKATK